jgi:aryl-alcohol dehydrogenase-like predicted oxidoreductase
MQTFTLPHTDLSVSRACFGAMTFGGQTDEPTARRMVDICMDRGINFFDTANSYNQGQSETVLGSVLKGRRDKVVLASKVGTPTGDPADASPLSKKSVLQNIDTTLRRLQTDYLDLYYMHLPDYQAPIEETLAALDEVVRAGKVRWLGTSNFASWQVLEAIGISEKHGYKPPYISQPMLNLLARGIEQEYVPFCKKYGVSMIVYNPLAGGLLTGKQDRDRPMAGTRFDNNRMYLERFWYPAYFDAVDEVATIARQAGRSSVDLSFSWLLNHTPTDVVLIGASKLEQLEQNLDVFGRGPLDAETVAALDRVWQNLRGVTPKYNR